MTISQLFIQNFRNHSKKSFSFSPETTIIIGPNGSGKTNILEALFLSAIGRSFRADNDREMITFGSEIARIKTEIIHSVTEKRELEIVLTSGQVTGVKTPYKKFLVNNMSRRMLDFVGNLKVVLFWPEDLELVIGSPSLRRRYLDFVLMQVDREYRRCLISYEKGIRQRNRLLESIRDVGSSRSQLIFWDQLLIKTGEYITKKREEYISFLCNYQLNQNIKLINYQITYDKSIISQQRFEQYKEEEVASATTLVGPHRDDMQFKIKDQKSEIKNKEEYRDLSRFGSRGEQRLAILWLKLGELAYVEKIAGERPVLLLDDIFSELDHPHRDIVFELMGKQQTILTIADEHFVENQKLINMKIIEL